MPPRSCRTVLTLYPTCEGGYTLFKLDRSTGLLLYRSLIGTTDMGTIRTAVEVGPRSSDHAGSRLC